MGHPQPQGRPVWALPPTNAPLGDAADAPDTPTPMPVVIARILL